MDHSAETPSKIQSESLVFPKWFPDGAKRSASRLHEAAVRDGKVATVALLVRLVFDERMKIVWAELLKRKRDREDPETKYFLHTAWRVPPHEVESHQHEIIGYLFRQLVHLTQANIPPALSLTKRDARQFEKTARMLRKDAEQLIGLGHTDFSNDLLKAAAGYGVLLETEVLGAHPGGDLRAQYMASRLAIHMRFVFGASMYTIVARLLSVALNREIKPTSVREWATRKLPKPKAM